MSIRGRKEAIGSGGGAVSVADHGNICIAGCIQASMGRMVTQLGGAADIADSNVSGKCYRVMMPSSRLEITGPDQVIKAPKLTSNTPRKDAR